MLLTVAKVTTLDVVLELAGTEATSGVGELEGPEEVGGLLEVGADSVDLGGEGLNADDAELAEVGAKTTSPMPALATCRFRSISSTDRVSDSW